MEQFFDAATIDVITKLMFAVLCGVLIGGERVWAHKTAGIRTYSLVAMGSALFVIISEIMMEKYIGVSGLNPLQIVSQIVVGVGFIGTGVIFSKDSSHPGLTTATGLWVSAGIGMASGFGLYSIAFITTILTLFIFIVLWFAETQIKKSKIYQEDHFEDTN